MPIWIVASDLVEPRLDHAVVARLDPLAPDLFVLFERLTVDRVADECPAIGRFDLEPVLRTCACERESSPTVRRQTTTPAEFSDEWLLKPEPRSQHAAHWLCSGTKT
jgi:hypothetical protein